MPPAVGWSICFSFFLIRYRQLAARSGDCVLTVSLSLSETHLGTFLCACGPRGAVPASDRPDPVGILTGRTCQAADTVTQ